MRPDSTKTTSSGDDKPPDHATAFFTTPPPQNVTQVAQTLAAHGGGAVSLGLAFDLVLNDLVEQAREVSGATGAGIALIRDGAMVCRATSGKDAPDLGVPVGTGAGLAGACISTGQVQLCRDTETDSRVNAEACRRLGVRSMLIAPLVDAGNIFGILQVFSAWPNSFGNREVTALEVLVRRIVESKIEAEAGTGDAPGVEGDSARASGAAFDSVHTAEAEKQNQASLNVPLDEPEKPRGNEIWTSILALLVIAAAVLLGVVIGWRGAAKGWLGSQPVPATSSTNAVNPVATASQPGVPPALEASVQSSASGSVTEPKVAAAGSSAPPPSGGLVITENGKVIYRMPPSEPGASSGRTAAIHSATRLINRVEPEYPSLARERNIQGPVVLDVQIDSNGAVENINVVTGEPVLAASAVQAVKQWRYQPHFIDGHPVESQTRITIKFTLPPSQ